MDAELRRSLDEIKGLLHKIIAAQRDTQTGCDHIFEAVMHEHGYAAPKCSKCGFRP